MSRGAQACAVLLAALLASAAFLASAWTPGLPGPDPAHPADFQILWAAGQGVAEGADVHDPAVLDAYGRRAGRARTPFAAAPPLVLALFAGFGADHAEAHRAWFAVNAAVLALCVVALGAALAAAGASPGWAAALALLLLLGDGSWHALAMNSTTLPALLAVLGALLAAQRDRPWLEGALLATAAALKIAPLWLLVVAALAGRRRTAWAGAAALALLGALSLALAGPELHLSWWREVRPRLGYGAVDLGGDFANSLHAWNLAPNGLLSRRLVDAGALAAGLAWAVTALVLVQSALLLRGRRARRATTDAAPHSASRPAAAREHARARLDEYGLGLAGALLVSSVTWPHHLGFAAPALGALLLAWPPRGVAGRARAAVALLLALVLGWPLGRADLTLELGAKAAALLALFALAAAHLARDGAVPGTPPGARPDAAPAPPGPSPAPPPPAPAPRP